MSQNQNINSLEENNIQYIIQLVKKNYKIFIISLFVALGLAFLFNRYTIPVYKISSSILIKEPTRSQGGDMNNFINSNLFGSNQNLQNELWVLKSIPVIEETVRNLDLTVNYLRKDKIRFMDAYKNVPFKILFANDHIQPVNVRFQVILQQGERFRIKAESKQATFYNFKNNEIISQKENWSFQYSGKSGELIETPELSFFLVLDSTKRNSTKNGSAFYFVFKTIHSTVASLRSRLEFNLVDRLATVIAISLKSTSLLKGKDIVNELMNVHSRQNLDRKNHIANITIDYIDKQLDEISSSLNQAEDNLQNFRSSHQLLDITEQATGITAQYIDLQNQMAELVSRKRYYDYVLDYLSKNDDFSNMIVPASMGISDQLLNNLMSELITAQAQRSNLIQSGQGQNPLVPKLNIQIENVKKTISENISAVRKTTDISIDEMNKRIRKVENQISRLPKTQRQLGGIERTYRLNDAIYNYMLEKRAEAKITQASNLPDNIIVEPATMVGSRPISPNKGRNYIVALFLGLTVPFGFLMIRRLLNNKIIAQEELEQLSDLPVMGKIMHNRKKTDNVMFEHPRSVIAESYRALRTNLDFHFRQIQRKIILVTSCIEGEGKSFTAQNLAMSYAQLDIRTLLIDFDLRKSNSFFSSSDETLLGLSSYLMNKAALEEIIVPSPHQKLDYIPSGLIPPNPVELLAIGKVRNLFEQLEDTYDCIVLDTSPLAQVSDAYLLMDYTDIRLIVTRYNYTIKKVFSLMMKDLKKKNMENICIILNDNRIYRDQYGYGYGYSKK